jgi:hypothetical protein
MRRAELRDVEFPEAGECAFNAVSVGLQEVHSAEYRVDAAAMRALLFYLGAGP